MSFELLDNVLLESGANITSGRSLSKDSEIFSELDSLVETAMRETLRNTIFSSGQDSDVKLEHLEIVENTTFTEAQLTKFMDTTIYPILEMSGAFNPYKKITISLPVYEAACLAEQVANDKIDEKEADEELEQVADFYDKDEDEVVKEATSLLKRYKLYEMEPSVNDVGTLVAQAGTADKDELEELEEKDDEVIELKPTKDKEGNTIYKPEKKQKLFSRLRATAGRVYGGAKEKWGKMGKWGKIGVGVGAALTLAAIATAAVSVVAVGVMV